MATESPPMTSESLLESEPQPSSAAATPPHLSHDPSSSSKRSDPFQFGQRYLADENDVFEYNAWDHVAPDEAHHTYCEEQYAKQRSNPVSEYDLARFNNDPQKWWDLFYKQKTSTFFKDRKWLQQEFPILDEVTQASAGPKAVLEVGAGAGNTAFPILRQNRNPDLMVYAYDFSKKAVATMRASPDYDERHIRAEVWDLAADPESDNTGLPPGLSEGSVDVVVMIFVFSALSPEQWKAAVHNVWRVLKPGGEVLFRDYGRGDLAQVRFKAGRWMGENFYVRGDGTRVYFFERDELVHIWGVEATCIEQDTAKEGNDRDAAEKDASQDKKPKTEDEETSGNHKFDILNLDVDRRLIVNRQRRIKMYRCWIQGRFQKPLYAAT